MDLSFQKEKNIIDVAIVVVVAVIVVLVVKVVVDPRNLPTIKFGQNRVTNS